MATTNRSVARWALWLLVHAFCASTATAASPLVDARLTVALVHFDGKVETSGPADAAKPGDVLEYRARYVNRGDAPATALMPTMPIPPGTEYLPEKGNSQKPSQASLDAITYAPIPLRRQQRGPDGAMHDVDVPLSEYRALRWATGNLAPGGEVTVRARVRVAVQPDVATR